MPQLEEVHTRLQESKKRRREIAQMCRDELSQSSEYQEIQDEMTRLRDERRAIEEDVRSNSLGIESELDGLKIEIATDMELLADIALNMYTSGENVEITDQYDNKYVPHFRVTFKKG